MNKFRVTGMLVLAGAIATGAVACPNCKKDFKFGQAVAIGNGMGFTWVRFNKETKKPESIGITLTETALEGLPKVEDIKDAMPMQVWKLDLPKEIKNYPFDHVEIEWNPVGHPPAPLYDKPHFDFHFFTISEEQVGKITATGEDLKKCQLKPQMQFVPAGFFLPPDTIVPNMGAHWINPKLAPELTGKPFGSTMLYGSYNGKTAFWEPMIAKSFLESKPDFSQALPAPKAYDFTGYFPTSYSVKYNADRKEFTISFDGLTLAKAAGPVAAPKAKKKK